MVGGLFTARDAEHELIPQQVGPAPSELLSARVVELKTHDVSRTCPHIRQNGHTDR